MRTALLALLALLPAARTAGAADTATTAAVPNQALQTEEEAPDAITHASPGNASAELGLDFLRASSSNDAGAVIAGDPSTMVAQEAGMRLRVDVVELTGRLHFNLDYQGREPVGGDVQDSTLRLLYRAELGYAFLDTTFFLAAGRFIAPSVNLLVVDGAHADLHFGALTISPFGGRRAISTSRRNIDFDRFDPAAGIAARWVSPRLQVSAAFAYNRDPAVVGKGMNGEATKDLDASNFFVDLNLRPVDELFAGGHLAFAERASYVLGPTWTTTELEVQALDLWNGVAYLEWRPLSWLRLGYNFHTQSTGVFFAGIKTSTAASVVPPASEPRFTDNEFVVTLNVPGLGLIRPGIRHRIRPDRTELRAGFTYDIYKVLGIFDGWFSRGFGAVERVTFDGSGPDLNRLVGSTSLGYRFAFGLEAEAGLNYIDRAQGPVSGRTWVRGDPGTPVTPSDLAPFAMEAQRLIFLRAFYADETWFGGFDLEDNLEDPKELRVLLQVGLLVEKSW